MLIQTKAQAGEELALRYLKAQGYEILAQNWRCFLGEVDLIARDNRTQTLVFVEIKSRQYDLDSGWGSIHRDKQKRLRRLALVYLKQKKLPLETSIRFDAAVVDLSTGAIDYQENAFLLDREF